MRPDNIRVMTCQGGNGKPFPQAIWSVLGSPRKRRVLAVVSDVDGPIQRSDLAASVVDAEREATADPVGTDEREDVEVELHHSILPKLETAGFLEYDATNGIVECGDLPLSGDEWLEPTIVDELEEWAEED